MADNANVSNGVDVKTSKDNKGELRKVSVRSAITELTAEEALSLKRGREASLVSQLSYR
jgi:hypothetical protein